VEEWYHAPLDHIILDEPSPPAAERIEEIEPDEYYANVGSDGRGLRVPTDLDELICRYFALCPTNRAKFDRAAFWVDVASRQWTISASTTFTVYVSAIEALIGQSGQGSSKRFRDFIETYAPDIIPASQRKDIYDLRSEVLHGGALIELDDALAFGWDPPWEKQRRLLWDLERITRMGLHTWLKAQGS
jgi:hypothetical protein